MSTLRVDNITDLGDDPVVTNGVIASVPGRNLLYNGAMQVAQRGTSTASITSEGYYTADRWNTQIVTMGTWTQSVEADGPTGSGFIKSLKMLCTTADGSPAAGDYVRVLQKLEGQDLQAIKKGTSSAESLTLSFWVKSNVTGTYTLFFYDADNVRQIGATYTISSSGTWEKKTVTLAPDTTGALDNDNASSLTVYFNLGAGSTRTSGSIPSAWQAYSAGDEAAGQVNVAASTSNYWQVTGVQLEAGTVATTFEHKAYGVELAECQRYYQRLGGDNVYGTIGYGFAPTTGTCNFLIDLPVQMRAAPTSLDAALVTISDFVSAAVTNYTLSIATATTTRSTVSLYSTNSPVVPFRPYVLTNNNSTSGYVGLNAEL